MSIFNQKSVGNSIINSRFFLESCYDNQSIEDNGQDIIEGLTKQQKVLPPRYFYDAKGSQLFEKICQLPEYYPTRTEAKILQKFSQEIATVTGKIELIELGSGSSTKTRFLLDAYQALDYPLTYIPIDVSGSILKESANSLLKDYPKLTIQGKVGTYQQCLDRVRSLPQEPKTILFLGSTIGNFDRQECDRFIELVTSSLNTGDYFLLGIDLQKSPQILEAAYNDSQGITAAFNLNILEHLNWKFQGNFDLNLFEHRAIYNSAENQIEMYLTSTQAHTVNLQILDLTINFAQGETILTEISRKFNVKTISQYLSGKQLELINSYTDPQQWFGLLLLQKK